MEKISLEHLRKLAYEGYRNTSFDPERRADQIIKDYTEELNSDIETIGENDRYKEKYIQLFSAWLSAKSRCFSVMITGGSNFNNRAHEKANNSEQKRYEEFREWRDRALKAIEKEKRDNRTPEQVEEEIWQTMRKRMIDAADTVIGIDNGTLTQYARPLFVRIIVGNPETAAKRGQPGTVKKALDLIRELNTKGSKPIITDAHKVWKLEVIAEAIREQKVDTIVQESKSIPFENGEIIFNHAMNRIQIKYNNKPSPDIITQLKKRAFRWSPTAGVWQRHLNNAGKYEVQNITGVKF